MKVINTRNPPPKAVGMCPKCGKEPFLTQTKYGNRWACCGLWSWGKSPLADNETHRARNAAHAAFDNIWKSKTLPRGFAYKLLAEVLEVEPQQAHMTVMNKELASKVPDAVKEIWRRLHAGEIDIYDKEGA